MATMLNPHLLLTIPLAPLAGAVIAGLFGTKFLGEKISRAASHGIAILGVAVAFALSVIVLCEVNAGAGFDGAVYRWMTVGPLKMEIGFLVDALTAIMMCVVSFVSLMVHVYTIGYLRDDPGYSRFFAYLSLFTFAMLMLVMSNNFLQLFFGWEAVGLVSYLLIGFWFKRPTAIRAGMKAFLVNRVGDAGFVLGIGLLLAYAGSLNYAEVFAVRETLATAMLPGAGWHVLTVACIALFIGAMGKSAQFPLHVWLPDSMEGPTPISALIHAATMVTAGIFMVARMSPLFDLSEAALSFILAIGAITALFMGILGIVQTDIKRVVAYSTLSQLGYMTVALGVSAYQAAVFHLTTHAFFKALLFLGAGSVIIGMHHDQDMRNMGGLRKYMPITWLASLAGALSLIGAPFFSGFYSKDSIIEAVRASTLPGAGLAYWAVLAGVFVTAFYTFRMYFLVFHGAPRFGREAMHHAAERAADHPHGLAPGQTPRESPWVVTVPLALLAIPSIALGAMAIRPMLFGEFFKHGVAFPSVIFNAAHHDAMQALGGSFQGWIGMALHGLTSAPFLLLLAGVALSWFFYLKRPDIPAAIARRFSGLYRLLDHQYYLNQINQIAFVNGALGLGRAVWRGADQGVIDGAIVHGSARWVGWLARAARRLQSGYIHDYAFAMLVGTLLLLTYFVFLNK